MYDILIVGGGFGGKRPLCGCGRRGSWSPRRSGRQNGGPKGEGPGFWVLSAKKVSPEFQKLIERAFLTCLSEKELALYTLKKIQVKTPPKVPSYR